MSHRTPFNCETTIGTLHPGPVMDFGGLVAPSVDPLQIAELVDLPVRSVVNELRHTGAQFIYRKGKKHEPRHLTFWPLPAAERWIRQKFHSNQFECRDI